MTSYFSIAVLGGLLPATVVAYQLAPRRARPVVLLAASLVFYLMAGGWLVVFVLGATAVSWLGGLALGRLGDGRGAGGSRGTAPDDRARLLRARRLVLAAGTVLVLGTLAALRLQTSVALPLGISFYSLQAVSYLADVYRGTERPDRNPARLALYLMFFPQVMEGPICRYGEVAGRLWRGDPVSARSLYLGGSRVLWGLAKTMVVANRLEAFVKPVFEAPSAYDGSVIAVAAALYTLQLYCDFSGTIDFAVGVGRVFGAEPPENFRQPFFSRTAAEFWRRWHITLGAWLRDYVFYPVSLSAPVKRLGARVRRAAGPHLGPPVASGAALLCVWLANGLWHGAGSQYLLFGMYYFVVIWLGSVADPLARAACGRLGVSREALPYRAMQHVRTLLVIVVGELLFRAASAEQGVDMLVRALTSFSPAALVDGTLLAVGMDAHDFAAVAAFSLALLLVGAARERGVSPLEGVWGRGPVARWALWCALIVVTVVFGAYGRGYVPVAPMYAQF